MAVKIILGAYISHNPILYRASGLITLLYALANGQKRFWARMAIFIYAAMRTIYYTNPLGNYGIIAAAMIRAEARIVLPYHDAGHMVS